MSWLEQAARSASLSPSVVWASLKELERHLVATASELGLSTLETLSWMKALIENPVEAPNDPIRSLFVSADQLPSSDDEFMDADDSREHGEHRRIERKVAANERKRQKHSKTWLDSVDEDIEEIFNCCWVPFADNAQRERARQLIIKTRETHLHVLKRAEIKAFQLEMIGNAIGHGDGARKKFHGVTWEGQYLCVECMCKVFCISRATLKRRMSDVRDDISHSHHADGEADFKRDRYGRLKENVIAWLTKYFEEFGENMPHSDQIHLNCITKVEIHKEMIQDLVERQEIHEGDLHFSYFCQIWNSAFKHVRIPKQPRMGKCDTCVRFKTKLLSNTLSREEREHIRKERKDHCEQQALDRRVYWKLREEAKSNPTDLLVIHIDGMDQVNIVISSRCHPLIRRICS